MARLPSTAYMPDVTATQATIASSYVSRSLRLQRLLQHIWAPELRRYFLVSALALGADIGIMVLLKEGLGLHYLGAAALGFVSGLITAYIFSIRWAFRTRSRTDWRQEFFLFAAIGGCGLCLNEVIMWVGTESLGLAYTWSKLIAAGHVFMFNFLIRKRLLFSVDGATDSCIYQTIRNASSSLERARRV